MVKITSLANNTSAYGYTNDSGFVSGYVPKNQNLKLEVIANVFCLRVTALYTQNIGPYTANVSLGTVNVAVPVTQVINFTGTVKNCSNQPVTNGYVSINIANGVSTLAYTNASGQVNFSALYCGGTTSYNYTAVDLSTGAYSNITTGTATTNAVNLGTITACGNTINTNGVYIAGGIDNNAVLWKDGVATLLTNNPANSNKYAYAVKTLVYNNDVYVLGNEEDSVAAAGYVTTIKLWKNGILTNITSGLTEAYGSGLDVYNGDVYIAGYEKNGIQTIGKIWKNGVATVLTKDSFDYVEPGAVKVANGDVYISGEAVTNAHNNKLVYWKNGTLNYLSTSNITYGEVLGIFVNNTDVYFAGYEEVLSQPIASYWKNGVKTALTFPSPYTSVYAYSIFVDNNDIYVGGSVHAAGASSYSNASYWKNNICGVLTNSTIAGEDDGIYGMFIKNNIVYTVGEHYQPLVGSTPLYLQNNVAVPLTGYTAGQDAYCNGIFVQ